MVGVALVEGDVADTVLDGINPFAADERLSLPKGIYTVIASNDY